MDTFGYVFLSAALIFVCGVIFLLYRHTDKLPRGSVLVIGILLWIAGQSASGSHDRLSRGLSGLITMIGFISVVFGVIQLTRKAPSHTPPPQPPKDENL
jgi:hypothetical protein